jgi:hypothetical protein
MKSIIRLISSAVPVNSILNMSIFQKKVSDTEYRNFVNKAELVEYVDSLYSPEDVDSYICITCQCGTRYQYNTKDDVPSESLICECGRKVIEYGV